MAFLKEILLPLLVALVAASPGIYALILGKRKQSADVAVQISVAAGKLIEQYKDRFEQMEQDCKENERELALHRESIKALQLSIAERDAEIVCRQEYIEHLLRGIGRIIAQLKSHTLTPVWMPLSWEEFAECNK